MEALNIMEKVLLTRALQWDLKQEEIKIVVKNLSEIIFKGKKILKMVLKL